MITSRSFDDTAVPPRTRIRATAVDLGAAMAWQAVLVAASRSAGGPRLARVFRAPATADLAQCLTSVLPVAVHLSVGEAGPRRASWGKHTVGLAVEGPGGAVPTASRIAVRTAVKLLPWQIAHLSLTRAVGVVPVRRPATWARAGFATALGLTAASCALALVRKDGRALHDLVAGTRVVRATDDEQPGAAAR